MLSILSASAEIIENGIMWLTAEGNILGVNEKLAKDLGYASKADFQPSTIFEVNPSTSILSWKRNWKKLLKEKQLVFKTEQITADEVIYPVLVRYGLLEINRDIICMAVIENLMQSNRYKDLLNLTSSVAGIGSWEWDLVQDDFLFTNEIYRLLDIPPNTKMDRKQFEDLIAKRLNEKERELFLKKLTETIKIGKSFEMDLSVQVSEGYEDFYFHAQPVRLEDRTIKLYGTLQNLSNVARRTDDLYFTRYCMDYARDMIFWVKKDSTIEYVNQTACDTLGYTKSELEGQSILLLSNEPEEKEKWKNHWQSLSTEENLDLDRFLYTKSGAGISVSIAANLIRYRGKEFNCAFVRNISKKKKLDELITMAKHSLDQSIDLIFWLRPDATFQYFNDAFIEKTGYTREEIEKMTIIDFFPDTKMEDFREEWEKLAEGVVIKREDRFVKLKDGSFISTEMTINLVKAGNHAYSSTVLSDITERRAKEQKIARQLEEIEQLHAEAQAENIQLKEEIKTASNIGNIISRDPNYKKVLRQVEQVAETNATVLITGETGTGKELLARAVHQLSQRYDRSMVKVNCAALPENLIESELFGHEKGAFTGAYQQKIGRFERAHKGTIFLDEIGELPMDLQKKILRVLQEGEIERVGGTQLIHIDVRVIAATNRKLEELVKAGKFREDLYYRLNVFPIYNIPLRERREDIPILVKHFAEKYSKKINKPIKEISKVGMNKLMTYNFLGNVRELENLIERAVILARDSVLTFDLPQSISSAALSSKFKSMEELQRDHIIDALEETHGKVSGKNGAAALLKMNNKTLASRMLKLNIDKLDYLKR